MFLVPKLYEIIIACSPGPDLEAFDRFIASNDRIGSYGIYVILIAILIHLIVNKVVFKKFFTFSLIFYAFLMYMHFSFDTGSGDCGMMYRDSTTYFAILSGFWIIFAPLITYSVKKFRRYLKTRNTTKPFANPESIVTE